MCRSQCPAWLRPESASPAGGAGGLEPPEPVRRHGTIVPWRLRQHPASAADVVGSLFRNEDGRKEMSVPGKHHYLPQFFMQRWADAEGMVTEYRRPRDKLVCKRKHPAQTGYLTDLYANESKADPIERQALEMVFMQKVDNGAADALDHIEEHHTKPTDPALRDAWSRFLMSLMHRSPERVSYLTAKVKEYEDGTLNPDLQKKYKTLRGPNDPPEYQDWLAEQGPLTPDLRVRLLKLLIDSKRIGSTFNSMQWSVYTLTNRRFGFLTGDHPIMISNGLGHSRGFALLAISPSQLFMAAHDGNVINAFETQRPNGLEQAVNDACTRQSHHVIIAHNDAQRTFVDRRFLKQPAPVGPNGFVTWNSPLIDL